MNALQEIRRHSLSAIVPVICLAAIVYFCYHAVEGERGINAYTRLSLQIQETQAALAAVTAQRQWLEHRAELLRADGLDADILEEQSRRALGMIKDGDLVILGR